MKNTTLIEFEVNQRTVKIVASEHAVERMVQRDIDTLKVISAIASVGGKNLNVIRKNNTEAMVIDKDNHLGVVFTMRHNEIIIITTIKKKNIFVKDNTETFYIQ